MRQLLVVLALVLTSACAVSSPACDPGLAWETTCDGRPEGAFDTPDGLMFGFAACGDAWEAQCGDPPGTSLTVGGGGYFCEADGTASRCDDGSEAVCMVVPCDGQTYYGPAHPSAD